MDLLTVLMNCGISRYELANMVKEHWQELCWCLDLDLNSEIKEVKVVKEVSNTKEIEKLQEEVAKLKAENEALNKKLAAKTEKSSKKTKAKLEADLEAEKIKLANANMDLADAQEELHKIKEELADVKATARKSYDDLKAKYNKLANNYNALLASGNKENEQKAEQKQNEQKVEQKQNKKETSAEMTKESKDEFGEEILKAKETEKEQNNILNCDFKDLSWDDVRDLFGEEKEISSDPIIDTGVDLRSDLFYNFSSLNDEDIYAFIQDFKYFECVDSYGFANMSAEQIVEIMADKLTKEIDINLLFEGGVHCLRNITTDPTLICWKQQLANALNKRNKMDVCLTIFERVAPRNIHEIVEYMEEASNICDFNFKFTKEVQIKLNDIFENGSWF